MLSVNGPSRNMSLGTEFSEPEFAGAPEWSAEQLWRIVAIGHRHPGVV